MDSEVLSLIIVEEALRQEHENRVKPSPFASLAFVEKVVTECVEDSHHQNDYNAKVR